MLKFYNFFKKINGLKTIQSGVRANTIKYFQTTALESHKGREKRKIAMYRYWQQITYKLDKNDYIKSLKSYKLMSYNILAQDLLVEHLQLYYNIDPKMLRWEIRLSKLKEEIASLGPDILCLQEMQYDHLKEFVNELNFLMQDKKLEYVFKKKTGTRTDGCAVIYDKNKFKLLSEQSLEYYTHGIFTLNRENIAIMCKFQPRDDDTSTFIVATTHLLYNPKREDVRISQVKKLIRAIIDFSCTSDSIVKNNHHPVILTGDFNFTPDTHAYKILTGKYKKQSANKGDDQNEEFFQMDSIDSGMANGASTNQVKWIIVDHILKSISSKDTKSVHVNSIYKLPSVQQCWENGKIPNKFFGSDHFSLAINFSIF